MKKIRSEYHSEHRHWNMVRAMEAYNAAQPELIEAVFWQNIAVSLGRSMPATRRYFWRHGITAKPAEVPNCASCTRPEDRTNAGSKLVKYLGVCKSCAAREKRIEATLWPEE